MGSKLETAKETAGTIRDLMTVVVDEAKDRSVNSLSAYVKKTFITSRVYIEDTIASDPLMIPLMRLLNETYTGLVLTALRLNEIVTGGKTVGNLTNAVATESMNSVKDLIGDMFGDKVAPATEDNTPPAPDPATGKTSGTGTIKDVKTTPDPSKLFCGRVVEATVGNTAQGKANLYFLVQLFPYILPTEVLEQFLTNNASPSLFMRWNQMKAGEISFWRDFVFECDRVAKRKKALRVDKDGILREIENHREGGLWKSIQNFLSKSDSVKNRNAANTIVVISKRRLDMVCRELGLNMRNYIQRQKLMGGTMTLMLVEYDPNYETVNLYMNGIRNRGEYSAQMIQGAVKGGGDAVDLKQLLTMIAAGNAPKF